MNMIAKSLCLCTVLLFFVSSFNNGQQQNTIETIPCGESHLNMSYVAQNKAVRCTGIQSIKGLTWGITSVISGMYAGAGFLIVMVALTHLSIYAACYATIYLLLPSTLLAYISYKTGQYARYNYFGGGEPNKKSNKSGYRGRGKKRVS